MRERPSLGPVEIPSIDTLSDSGLPCCALPMPVSHVNSFPKWCLEWCVWLLWTIWALMLMPDFPRFFRRVRMAFVSVHHPSPETKASFAGYRSSGFIWLCLGVGIRCPQRESMTLWGGPGTTRSTNRRSSFPLKPFAFLSKVMLQTFCKVVWVGTIETFSFPIFVSFFFPPTRCRDLTTLFVRPNGHIAENQGDLVLRAFASGRHIMHSFRKIQVIHGKLSIKWLLLRCLWVVVMLLRRIWMTLWRGAGGQAWAELCDFDWGFFLS